MTQEQILILVFGGLIILAAIGVIAYTILWDLKKVDKNAESSTDEQAENSANEIDESCDDEGESLDEATGEESDENTSEESAD